LAYAIILSCQNAVAVRDGHVSTQNQVVLTI